MLAHLVTASGAVVGLWGLHAAAANRFRDAFLAMIAAVVIDAVDGWLARRLDVERHASFIDGARLDDIVDYLTYVVLPAFVVLQAGVVPAGWAWPVAAAMLLSSAMGFSWKDAKTAGFFTGFPSYWNIVVFYLAAGGLPRFANAAVLLFCAAMVFVRVPYVYPTRMQAMRTTTLGLGAVWALLLIGLAWQFPDVPRGWLALSLLYPAYYIALSVVLGRRASRRM
jgi:phosphatidylcholine synthase